MIDPISLDLLTTSASTSLQHLLPNFMMDAATSQISMHPEPLLSSTSTFMVMDSFLSTTSSSTTLLSFSDQGQNLAGIFFQASLLPYLVFLYFLGFRGNRVPNLGYFGFQFLLVFVLGTIPSGIVTKTGYGLSLANVDWLHGAAESLLTVTNILIVLGFRNASIDTPSEWAQEKPDLPKMVALGIAGIFALGCFVGPALFGPHSPFLFGLGDLPTSISNIFPWVAYGEPDNALSIPTWAIHFSSVFEFLFAMNVVWDYSTVTQNESWKGLTWGMLPLHASGIAACTYHVFYNNPDLQFLVTTQAGLTLLGNITLAIAAIRIALSNGWTLSELDPFPKAPTSPMGLQPDAIGALPLQTVAAADTDGKLAIKLTTLTLATAYVVKYGELGLDVFLSPNAGLGAAIVAGIPAITAFTFYNKSKGKDAFALPQMGGKDGEGSGLSMADIKKFGVAGTVAYVLTELAFWAVAFPVASAAYFQSQGHWPDLIADSGDRAIVLGFVFAGANVARLLLPLRLGAALAVAPWVDENIIARINKSKV
eukprot:CAMPEP_0118680340 /NCGR_PEP_ID=MMETSP0800-20121206/4308_1 /TAXON_ID=210618 ORGANISM="Striatella unipunctata, Strain CCMP2910" /NCGR_SAMPLE_ID=MMETSP0800 /ASSEMBLY_ACC=CAM_ASM_000638 /LENGTH=536 /DNA_ID=CAMNT_0006576473 /DNA_START=70 /DNA_END=1680 /DNA_ORIENTATION=+